MRLAELKKQFGGLPKTAGKAILQWEARHRASVDTARRDGSIITLPECETVEFFPLLDGEQFLLVVNDAFHKEDTCFFGGTDENPFLVRLSKMVVGNWEGEEAFFSKIKPKGVKIFERNLGVSAIRQGDWFAVPLPSMEFASLIYSCMTGKTFDEVTHHQFKGENKMALAQTRHFISQGWCIGKIPESRLACQYFAEGLLIAPDHHSPRTLKGPHALFQTQGLVDRLHAD